jgi:hypothetical protein
MTIIESMTVYEERDRLPFAPSRFEAIPLMTLGGLQRRFTMYRAGGIPLLWNEFNKARHPAVELEPDNAYGVVVSGNRHHFD